MLHMKHMASFNYTLGLFILPLFHQQQSFGDNFDLEKNKTDRKTKKHREGYAVK